MSQYSYTLTNWNPELLYRANRTRDQPASVLEEYAEANILSLFRTYMPVLNPNNKSLTMPNFDYGPIVEDATRLVNTIDMFDENEGLLDQVIFGVANPDLCHPGIGDIARHRNLIAVLLVRHFKKFGGLILPPLQAARTLQDAHLQVVRADQAAGRAPSQMHYLVWNHARLTSAPPGLGGNRGGSAMRGGRGGGNVGGDRGGTRGGYSN